MDVNRTAKHGTCCRQTACLHKIESLIGDERCSDLVGLLSCSVCHTNSAEFARSITNITICPSFCDELYDACGGSSTGESRTQYCQSEFGVSLVPSNFFSPYGVWSFCLSYFIFFWHSRQPLPTDYCISIFHSLFQQCWISLGFPCFDFDSVVVFVVCLRKKKGLCHNLPP